MKIIQGISHSAVLQRHGIESCHCNIAINSHGASPIALNAYSKTKQLIPSAKLINYTIHPYNQAYLTHQFELVGLPVGGPYELVFTDFEGGCTEVKDVYVGDLFLLAGQSNMEGIGKLAHKASPHPMTRAYGMNELWTMAEDPIHDLTIALDPVHTHINGGPFEPRNPLTGVGPGVAFGHYLHEMTGFPIGLIPCAHGGTSMDQWSPNYKDNNGYGLFQMMLNRLNQVGGYASGLLWYQGCSDTHPGLSESYYDKMMYFVDALRRKTSEILPIVIVQISRTCSHDSDSSHWNRIQADQLLIKETLANCEVISSIDLEMDDFIHISGKSQQALGVRCGKAMFRLINHLGHSEPKLKSISLENDGDSWNQNIRLKFDNVSGGLIAEGRPNGFTIKDCSSGKEKNYIYHTELLGDEILIKTTECALDLSQCVLSYGAGFMPYCNITDEENRALPAFHNQPLGICKPLCSPFTSSYISHDDDLTLEAIHSLKLSKTDFWYYFLNASKFDFNLHKTINYHLPFTLSGDYAEVPINIYLGGAGQLRLLIDTVEIENITLTPPISPDQIVIKANLEMGHHLITVVYEPNDFPKGIFVRLGFETELHARLCTLTL